MSAPNCVEGGENLHLTKGAFKAYDRPFTFSVWKIILFSILISSVMKGSGSDSVAEVEGTAGRMTVSNRKQNGGMSAFAQSAQSQYRGVFVCYCVLVAVMSLPFHVQMNLHAFGLKCPTAEVTIRSDRWTTRVMRAVDASSCDAEHER